MSTASNINPPEGGRAVPPPSPQPLQSVIASAHRLTAKSLSRRVTSTSTGSGWQEEAWEMYDLVGEQHFLVNTLAGRLSQADFFVGVIPEDSTEDVIRLGSDDAEKDNIAEQIPAGDDLAISAFSSLVGTGATFGQMIRRLGLNLLNAAEGYLLGADPEKTARQGSPAQRPSGISPLGVDSAADNDVDLTALEWSALSISEVSLTQEGTLKVENRGPEGAREYNLDDVFLIRVWNAHPARWWEADSATRAALPVLRELVGLTMHISAQIDSRLAGAGVFFIPQTADAAMRHAAGLSEDDPTSPFSEALLEAMTTPIKDRDSASALVPLMPIVPDETIEKFRYLTFATPLDAEAREMRDEAIRRLALSQDCPPEILLGVGAMNHWGAWLVREDVVVTHLEPPLALICDALTTQFLWPVLESLGVEDYKKFVIWYDVSDLVLRPDRSASAKDLHASGVISDSALRYAAGFDDADAPEVTESDPALQTVLSMIASAPSLAQDPGIPALYEQMSQLIAGVPASAPAEGDGNAATSTESGDNDEAGTDDTDGGEGPPRTSEGDSATDTTAPPTLSATPAANSRSFGAFPFPAPTFEVTYDR